MSVLRKEILLTGSTGIAGNFAAQELFHRNYSMRLIVRNFLNVNKFPLTRYVQGDLAQIDHFEKISRSNSGIVHYACASLRSRADPEIDVKAMKVLLKNWGDGPFCQTACKTDPFRG